MDMDACTSEALAFGLVWASLVVGFMLVLQGPEDGSFDE
jgi:hypothetical protein